MKQLVFAIGFLFLLSATAFAACNVTAPMLINTSNTYWCLAANSTNAANGINLTATNITLDCQGYAISGINTTGTYGVWTNATYANISNCVISNFTNEIDITAGNHDTIWNNTLTSNNTGGSAILTNGYYLNITNNTINQTSLGDFAAIYLYYPSTSSFYSITGNSINLVTTSTCVNAPTTTASQGSGIFSYGPASSNYTNNVINISATATKCAGIFDYSGSASVSDLIKGNVITAKSSASCISNTGEIHTGAGALQTYDNNTCNAVSGYGVYVQTTGSYINITGSYINSTGSDAVYVPAGVDDRYFVISNNTLSGANALYFGAIQAGFEFYSNNITNNVIYGTAAANAAISDYSGAYNVYNNNTIQNNCEDGVSINGITQNETITNNHISCNIGGGIGGGIYLNPYTSAVSYYNHYVANNTINESAGNQNPYDYAIRLGGTASTQGITNSTFINNTLITNTTVNGSLVYISSLSNNNTFYWNNFTSTGGIYVNDTNGSNNYNTSANGTNEGNIWANVINGNTGIGGSTSSVFPGLNYGSSGSGYPYNSTNSQGKLVGGVTDYAPLTPYSAGFTSCGALNTANTVYNLTSSLSVGGMTCFNVTVANVTLDCHGYAITGTNASSTYGVYSNQAGTIVKNCIISSYTDAVYLNFSANGTISNDSLIATTGSALFINESNFTQVKNDTFYSASGDGVFIALSNYSNVTGSNISFNTLYGLETFGDYNAIIMNDTSLQNTLGGMLINGSNSANISNISASSSAGNGLYLQSSNSTIVLNSSGASTSGYGIYISFSASNIFNLTNGSSSSSYGIYLASSSSNSFNSSAGSSTTANAVYLDGSSNLDTFNCQGVAMFTTNNNQTYGIYSPGSNYGINVTNCNMTDFHTGIFIGNATSSFILNDSMQADNFNTISYPKISYAPYYTSAYSLVTNNSSSSSLYMGCNVFNAPSSTAVTNPPTVNIQYKRSDQGAWTTVNTTYNSIVNVYTIGDSITKGTGGGVYEIYLDALLGSNSSASGHNNGIPSAPCSSVLTNYTNTVPSGSSVTVVSLCGINDLVSNSNTPIQVEAAIDSIYNESVLKGNNLVLTTIGPDNSFQNNCSSILAVNTWLINYTATHLTNGHPIPLVDFYHDIWNGTDCYMASNYSSGDGLHPNDLGAQVWAYDIWSTGFAHQTPYNATVALTNSDRGKSYSYMCYINDGVTTSAGISNASVSSSILTQDSITLLLNGTSANLSYTFNASYNLTVNSSSTSGNDSLYQNTTPISRNYSAVLGAGSYVFTANSTGNSNYSGASVSYYVTVTKAPDALTLLLNGSAGNTSYVFNASYNLTVNSSSASGTDSLYKNGTNVSRNYSAVLNGGYYNFTVISNGNGNYSANTLSYFVIVSSAADNVTLVINGSASNVTYAYNSSYAITANATSTSGTHTLYLNGSAVASNYSGVLPAGLNNFTAISTGNVNYSGGKLSYFANVTPLNSTISLNATSWSITSGTQSNVNCSIDDTQTPVSLYLNGVLAASGTTSVADVETLSAGSYNYTCNSTGSQNYTAPTQQSNILTVTGTPPAPTPSPGPVTGGGSVGSGSVITPPTQPAQPPPLPPPPANVTPPQNVTSAAQASAQQAIGDAQAAINSALSGGKDTSGAALLISAAQDAMAAGDYAKALQLASEAKSMAAAAQGAQSSSAGRAQPLPTPTVPESAKPALGAGLLALIAGGIAVAALAVGAYVYFFRGKGRKGL